MTSIMSSPMRNAIDPLISLYSEEPESDIKIASTPNNLSSKTSRPNKRSDGLSSDDLNTESNSSNSISDKKISDTLTNNNASNTTLGSNGGNSGTNAGSLLGSSGWTPFLSRTTQPEGIFSHVSTPSSKMLGNLYKPNHNLLPLEFDCASLNLTPFLAHNMNIGQQPGAPSSATNNINFTPLCDKSLHLADFFMDSPIRQTPRKTGAFTPSRFTIAPELRSAIRGDCQRFSELSLKRSITLIDTPARQPFKKMEQSRLNDDHDHHDDEDDDGDVSAAQIGNVRISADHDDSDNNENYTSQAQRSSKDRPLSEVSPNVMNKTPFRNGAQVKNKLQTPAHPVSSPSTVIMSSVTKSPEKGKILAPASPTPQKEMKIDMAEPVMGIFSERKPTMASFPDSKLSRSNNKKPPRKQAGGMNRFQIVFTDVHTLMNSKKKKAQSAGNGGSNNTDKAELRQDRKQKKQQPKEERLSRGNVERISPRPTAGMISSQPIQPNHFPVNAPSYVNQPTHNFNTSMNTSREFSMINNLTLNTTATNLTASDQSSFDLMHGGLMSTPNGKCLQDLLFEKFSPGASHNIVSSKFSPMNGHLQGLENFQSEEKLYMPPPKTLTLQQAAQNALRHRHQLMEGNVVHNGYRPVENFGQYSNQQPFQQMSMIHPDLQNAHHGIDMQGQEPSQDRFQVSTPQQPNNNAMHNYDRKHQQSPSGNELMAYLYQQLDQYSLMNMTNLSGGAVYSTSPTQDSRKERGRRRRQRK